jgi:hypothetical protein
MAGLATEELQVGAGMLLDPIICCHVGMAAEIVAAWAWRTVIALQVLILCPMIVTGLMAVTAEHLGLDPVNVPLPFAIWILVLGLDPTAMTASTSRIDGLYVSKVVACHQSSANPRRAAHVTLAARRCVARVTVVLDGCLEQTRVGGAATGKEHGSVPSQTRMEVVPGIGNLLSVTVGTQVG